VRSEQLAGLAAGVSLARITWQDELGAEHLSVATERSWALAQPSRDRPREVLSARVVRPPLGIAEVEVGRQVQSVDN
jgi:hypothetical protein